MLVDITIEVIALYNKTLRRRRRKVEIREVFSLQLKEIRIHVIFTFLEKESCCRGEFFLC